MTCVTTIPMVNMTSRYEMKVSILIVLILNGSEVVMPYSSLGLPGRSWRSNSMFQCGSTQSLNNTENFYPFLR